LASITKNVSNLSKRCHELQQQARKDEIDEQSRIEKIRLLEEKLDQLLFDDNRQERKEYSIVSASRPDHRNYDRFSPDDRETIISLEKLLAIKLSENKELAIRSDDMTKLIRKEIDNGNNYEQLPADVTELDALLATNNSSKPHNRWLCVGQPMLYCMRCDCNETHVCFVGQTTKGELWHKVGGHFNDLWRKVQGRRLQKRNTIMYVSKDFGESSFADHVVRKHLRHAPSREAVLSWSGEMIRISIVEAHADQAKALLNDLLGSSSV
jgi:hypothetical protein